MAHVETERFSRKLKTERYLKIINVTNENLIDVATIEDGSCECNLDL